MNYATAESRKLHIQLFTLVRMEAVILDPGALRRAYRDRITTLQRYCDTSETSR